MSKISTEVDSIIIHFLAENRDVGIKLGNSNWIDIGPGQTWMEVTGDYVG